MKKKIVWIVLVILSVLGYFIYEQTKFSTEDIILEFNDVDYVEYGETFDPMTLIKECSGEVKYRESIDSNKVGKQVIVFVVKEEGLSKEFKYEIEVKDSKAPKIVLNKEKIHLKYGEQYDLNKNIKSVKDVVDGDISYKNKRQDVDFYTIESDIDFKQAGDYKVRVIAVDKNHNQSEKTYTITVDKEEKQDVIQPDIPPVSQPSYTAKPNHRVIVIDPGHQGQGNNGLEAIGPGSSTMKAKVSSGTAGIVSKIPESKINLQVGLKLKGELEARGYTVIMTRTSQDVNISNQQRANIGNKYNAAAVIHLHCDGGVANARGAHTIAIAKNNPYCSQLYKASSQLAKNVIDSYCQTTGMKNRGISYRNDLTGLNWSQVPSIYLEMGFLSNQNEDRLLTNQAFQEKCVKGIANGIDAYFR